MSKELETLTRHQWQNNKAVVVTYKTADGVRKHGKTVLDFDLIGVVRFGLLEAIIRDAPCPAHLGIANSFRCAISAAAKDTELKNILSTTPAKLTDKDITKLARFIDREVATWKRKDKYGAFIHAWTFVSYLRQPLATGQLIKDVRVVSQHSSPTKTTKLLISDKYDETFDDPELANPIGALQFDDISNQKSAAIRHLQARLDRIKEACQSVIAHHHELVARLSQYKRRVSR